VGRGVQGESLKQKFFLGMGRIFSGRTCFLFSLTFAPSVSTSPFNLEDPERNQKQELLASWADEATKLSPLKHFREKENRKVMSMKFTFQPC